MENKAWQNMEAFLIESRLADFVYHWYVRIDEDTELQLLKKVSLIVGYRTIHVCEKMDYLLMKEMWLLWLNYFPHVR